MRVLAKDVAPPANKGLQLHNMCQTKILSIKHLTVNYNVSGKTWNGLWFEEVVLIGIALTPMYGYDPVFPPFVDLIPNVFL